MSISVIAERIRNQRQAKGLSQRALAEAVGISRTTLAAMESGSDGVTLGLLCKVLDYLDMGLETKKVVRLPSDGVFTKRPTLAQMQAMRNNTARAVV